MPHRYTVTFSDNATETVNADYFHETGVDNGLMAFHNEGDPEPVFMAPLISIRHVRRHTDDSDQGNGKHYEIHVEPGANAADFGREVADTIRRAERTRA